MSVLTQAWEDCRGGHGSIVLLAGDAGIGKTRLAEELAADVETGGGMVAWGRCHDAEGLPAYWPWIQMLRHLIENAPDEELRHDLQEGVEELTAVIPELRQRVPGIPAGEPDGGRTDRERFFRAVTDYLSWSSRRHPLLLILDDLHVADPSSLRLLQAIAPEVSSSPLLILATYRDTELGPGHPLVGDSEGSGAHPVPPSPDRGTLGRRRGAHHEHEHWAWWCRRHSPTPSISRRRATHCSLWS